MAEALVNARMADRWQSFSAGTVPAGYIHPKALLVLAEIGIDHHGQSKSVENFLDQDFDLVVTVCDSAAEECPLWLGRGKRIHHSFIDPSKATGSDEEILEIFRQVRDQIAVEIPDILTNYE
jgi:arsenate reductase